jgi:hypothetical protein
MVQRPITHLVACDADSMRLLGELTAKVSYELGVSPSPLHLGTSRVLSEKGCEALKLGGPTRRRSHGEVFGVQHRVENAADAADRVYRPSGFLGEVGTNLG